MLKTKASVSIFFTLFFCQCKRRGMHKDRDANINSLVLSIQILHLRGHGIIQRGSTITESSSYPIISFLLNLVQPFHIVYLNTFIQGQMSREGFDRIVWRARLGLMRVWPLYSVYANIWCKEAPMLLIVCIWLISGSVIGMGVCW